MRRWSVDISRGLLRHLVLAVCVSGLLLAAGLSARADITIKFDDLKDGDKISDVMPVVVHADSGDGIDKVEFAVDDQLRFSTGSSPYTYKWDTIADTEGAHSLAVTATDANGNKKTVKLSVTIDNDIALGADALAQKAREALLTKDFDTASRYSRRALKAEPDNIIGSRALAAIFAERLNWDKAVSTLEKAKNLDGSAGAMFELAGYRMQRAVLPENSASLVADFQAASELMRKAAVKSVEAVKARNLPNDLPSSHDVVGDAYFGSGRYAEAITEYSKSASGGALPSVNRLALAYILNEQPQEAAIILRPLIKDKTADAASHAVLGLAMLRSRRFAEARDAVRGDVGSGNASCLTIAAYADAVLGKPAGAASEAAEAVTVRPLAGETHFANSMALIRLTDSEPEVLKALQLSPFQTGPLVDYAVRYSLLKEHPDRFDNALKLLDLALKNDAQNRSAQLAKVLILFHQKRIAEAEPILAELNRRDADSADVQVAASIYFDIKGNPTAAEERLRRARALDSTLFDLGTTPKPLDFLYADFRKTHYRSGFYLSPETLYAANTAK